MGLLKQRKAKRIVIEVKEAEMFLRGLGIDINQLGLPYLPDTGRFNDGRDYSKWFENLKAEPVARKGEDSVVKITGLYAIQPKGSNPHAKKSPGDTDFHPCGVSYTNIDLEIRLADSE